MNSGIAEPWKEIVHKGLCYGFFRNNVEFDTAQNLCFQLGGILAMPKTKATNTFLAENIDHRAWIGLSDKDDESTFEWLDHTMPSYNNFPGGEGDNYILIPNFFEDCVTLDPSGTWHDRRCGDFLFIEIRDEFICQFKIPSTTASITNPTTTPTAKLTTVILETTSNSKSECPPFHCDKKCGFNGNKVNPVTGCLFCECNA